MVTVAIYSLVSHHLYVWQLARFVCLCGHVFWYNYYKQNVPHPYYFEKLLQKIVKFFIMSVIEFNTQTSDSVVSMCSFSNLSNVYRLALQCSLEHALYVLYQLPRLCSCLLARIQLYDAFCCKEI